MFAKLEDGRPRYAPRRMQIGGAWVYNPTSAMLTAAGYLPVIETEPPETDDQHYAEPRWTEENGQIVQTWTVEEIPISDEEAITRFANSITGAYDHDLISATETLIEQKIKEE